jgi:hypothetical protein
VADGGKGVVYPGRILCQKVINATPEFLKHLRQRCDSEVDRTTVVHILGFNYQAACRSDLEQRVDAFVDNR